MKGSKLSNGAIALTLIALVGCDGTTNFETDEIHASFKLESPPYEIDELLPLIGEDNQAFLLNSFEVSAKLSHEVEDDLPVYLTLSEGDKLTAIYNGNRTVLNNNPFNSVNRYDRKIFEELTSGDQIDIEFTRNDTVLLSELMVETMPFVNDAEGELVLLEPMLNMRWENGSLMPQRLYIRGNCLESIDLPLGAIQTEFTYNFAEHVKEDAEPCKGLAIVEWSVSGTIDVGFNDGHFFGIIRKLKVFTH